MNEVELKPCPFCGSKDVTVYELYPISYARCRVCGAEGSLRDSHDEAAAAWNSRTYAKGLLGRIADLVDRPTCKNSEDLYDGSFFECSECGEGWELTCGGPADNHLCFCPRCGAEVV